MTIASAIVNKQQQVAACYTAISNKGGTLPATQDVANMPTAIASIPGGTPPPGSINPMDYIGLTYSMVQTYDSTKQSAAKLIYMSNPSAAQGADILNLNFDNAEVIIAPSSASAQYCPNVTSLNFSKLKYIYIASGFFMIGSSTYPWNGVTGTIEFPELEYIAVLNIGSVVYFFTWFTNITKIIAKKLKYVDVANNYAQAANLYLQLVQECSALKYINLESFVGNINKEIRGYLLNSGVGSIECLILGDIHSINFYLIHNSSHPNLTTLVFNTTQVPALGNSWYLFGSPANNPHFDTSGSNDGSIYVPDALVNEFKVATNWSAWASYIKPISQFNNTWES